MPMRIGMLDLLDSVIGILYMMMFVFEQDELIEIKNDLDELQFSCTGF